jgi:hypothetical protein
MAKKINLEKLNKDMERWPKSWAGFDSDMPMGKEIVCVIFVDEEGGPISRHLTTESYNKAVTVSLPGQLLLPVF